MIIDKNLYNGLLHNYKDFILSFYVLNTLAIFVEVLVFFLIYNVFNNIDIILYIIIFSFTISIYLLTLFLNIYIVLTPSNVSTTFNITYNLIYLNYILRIIKFGIFKNLFVISNLSTYHNINNKINGQEVINISDNIFLKSKYDFNHSLILLTNNNLAQIGPSEFSQFIEQFDSAVVAIHDFDNHHWYHLSIACSVVADVYVPAHMSSNIVQSRINPNIDISLPCGTIQWTRELLFDHFEKIINLNRTKSPLGMHNFYEKFKIFR